MDPQERQKRNRELKLETDRQDRDHKKALRAGIASAHEGVETSITPPSHSTTNVPTSAPVAPAASTQQSIPDHAIEVSLGASVLYFQLSFY